LWGPWRRRKGNADSGHIVLTDERVAQNRPPPLVIRAVLVQECESIRDQHRA